AQETGYATQSSESGRTHLLHSKPDVQIRRGLQDVRIFGHRIGPAPNLAIRLDSANVMVSWSESYELRLRRGNERIRSPRTPCAPIRQESAHGVATRRSRHAYRLRPARELVRQRVSDISPAGRCAPCVDGTRESFRARK